MTAATFSEFGSHIHFMGIGGMGMAPLAMVLAESGFAVTGEDLNMSAGMAARLNACGIRIPIRETLDEAVTTLVYSSALPSDHPRLLEARHRGLCVHRRGEALALYARNRRLIAVVGSHGKTSTCAMLVTALRTSGLDVGYVMGGLFADPAIPPALLGSCDWLVAEVDESDGTIGLFSPEVMLCVNVDYDHCDRYDDLGALESVFRALAGRTSGAVFYCRSCPVSHRLFDTGDTTGVVSFGPGGDYDLLGADDSDEGRVLRLGGRFGSMSTRVRALGAFNSLNACGALAVADFLGQKVEENLLAAFPGVHRRQSILIEGPHLTVMEDYAHHPSEIRVLFDALRSAVGKRLVVVFQPHRYSRTARFKSDFAAALASADHLFIMDVYPACEAPLEGGRLEDLVVELQRCRKGSYGLHTVVVADDAAGREKVAEECREGDLLIFVGAGSIDRFAIGVVDALCHRKDRMGRLTGFFRALNGHHIPKSALRIGEPLARKTTIGIGGAAEIYAEPASLEELRVLLAAADASGIPVQVLGRGSNLIVPDEGVTGLVLRLQHQEWRRITKLDDDRVQVGAGVRLKELSGQALKEGWEGFEFLEGIPGTLGGALRMNAGAMGGWIFELVEEVQFVTLSGEVRHLRREALKIEYRCCEEIADAIAVGATLRLLPQRGRQEIEGQLIANRDRRQGSQPREPSAGCIFKNPEGTSAGRLIDEVGLKGERVGGAEVSRIHGNFIVNLGAATADDVVALVRRVRECVLSERQVVLEPEVLLFGMDWNDVLRSDYSGETDGKDDL